MQNTLIIKYKELVQKGEEKKAMEGLYLGGGSSGDLKQ
jgi:hypothetical protein